MKKRRNKKLLCAIVFSMLSLSSCADAQADDVSSWENLKSTLENFKDAKLTGDIQAAPSEIDMFNESEQDKPRITLDLNNRTITGADTGTADILIDTIKFAIKNGTIKGFNNAGDYYLEEWGFIGSLMAKNGGALFNASGNVYLDKVNFENNHAVFGGAVSSVYGIMNPSPDDPHNNVLLSSTDTNYTGDSAGYGGAIFNAAIDFRNKYPDKNYDALENQEIADNPDSYIFADKPFAEPHVQVESYYGPMEKNATVNIKADTRDVTFSGNKASVAGGAIFNTSIVNIEAAEGKTVTFATGSDTIYNDGELNLGSNNGKGNIVINSAITDETIDFSKYGLNGATGGKGITNINGGTVTLGKGAAITQKEINIKSGILDAREGGLITGALKVETQGEAGLNADTLTSSVVNNGKVALYKGTLAQDITGAGSTSVEGAVTNNAKIGQKVEINKTGNLTSSADNITGIVEMKEGTYNINGGKISQAISGSSGNVNITGDVISSANNSYTGNVTVKSGARLALGDNGDLFDSAEALTAENDSTISLLDKKQSAGALKNLQVSKGDAVKLEADWNDKLATSSLEGNIKLSKLDLTNANGDYEITSSIKDKISLSDDIELTNSSADKNFLSYNTSDGKLSVSKVDSVSEALKKDTSGVYQMSKDETLTGENFASGDLIINGRGKSLNSDSGNAIKVENGKKLAFSNIKINTAIQNNNEVNLSSETEVNNKITGGGTTNITGNITLNSSIEGNTLNINSGIFTLGQNADIASAKSLTASGGTLSLQNNKIQDTNLGNLTLNQDLNLNIDGNFKNKELDTIFVSDKFNANNHHINISNIKILEPATAESFGISPISENMDKTGSAYDSLKGAIDYTGGEIVYSPIYKYKAAYNAENGMLNFSRGTGGGYEDYNESVMAASVAAQLGGYLNQLNSYDEAFRNMDMYMLLTKKQRQAMKYANKYASSDSNIAFDPISTPYDNTSAWVRPYAVFENVKLKRGPKVSNVSYGTYFGGESELMDLGSGWDGMFGAYLGYNGSHQAYDGIGIYQNGAALGLVGMAYKDNFFAGLTANVGSNIANADTLDGSEDFTLLMSGIAAKTGYNWELADGRFIIQPNYMMSYSFVNTFDYTNASGIRINSDPLHAVTLEPGVKFIGNLNNGWQPYAGVSVVWNVMDKTQFNASDTTLPELSVKPFVKYGAGIRKTWGERITGFFQTFLTSGGRNGVGLQAGLRWTLGNNEPKHANSMGEKKYIANK